MPRIAVCKYHERYLNKETWVIFMQMAVMVIGETLLRLCMMQRRATGKHGKNGPWAASLPRRVGARIRLTLGGYHDLLR